MITFSITIITAVIAIICTMALRQEGQQDEDTRTALKVGKYAGFTAAIVTPLFVGFTSTFRTIPPGNVGVETRFGAVSSTHLEEGFNITVPWAEVTPMSIQLQKHVATYTAATKDMQTVHVDMVLNFRLHAAQAPAVYQQTGIHYVDVIVDPAAQEVLKAETAKHDASDLLKNRPSVKDAVQGNLKGWLKKYHLDLEEVAIADIKFDKTYQTAIEEKQKQQQIAQQREYELQQAIKEAEIAKAKAEGLANATQSKARGDAEALKLRGQAESEYNLKISQSLTPEILRARYIEKWNGELPKVDGSGKATFLMNIDSEKK